MVSQSRSNPKTTTTPTPTLTKFASTSISKLSRSFRSTKRIGQITATFQLSLLRLSRRTAKHGLTPRTGVKNSVRAKVKNYFAERLITMLYTKSIFRCKRSVNASITSRPNFITSFSPKSWLNWRCRNDKTLLLVLLNVQMRTRDRHDWRQPTRS